MLLKERLLIVCRLKQGVEANLRTFQEAIMDVQLTDSDREKIRAAFGDLVRARRQALGLSQEELAFRSGLHRTYVGSVERGERNLSLENIFVFASALQCDPKELIPTTSNKAASSRVSKIKS